MNWVARVLAIVAHDLRSPAAVISGYARLLAQNRLPEAERIDALNRIERATERILVIGQRTSDLAHWLTPHPATRPQSVTVSALVEHALAGATGTRLVAGNGVPTDSMRVRALDRGSLAVALRGVLDTVHREMAADDLLIVATPAEGADSYDLLIGPPDRLQDSVESFTFEHADPAPPEDDAPDLTFALAATIIRAHEGQMWTVGGRRGVVGVRLPAGA